MRRVLLSVCLAGLSALLGAAPAAAAGAAVQHLNLSSLDTCSSYYGYTFCQTGKGEENITQTPSGNESGEVNGSVTYTASYNGTPIYSSTQNVHEHILINTSDGTLREGGVHQTGSYTYGGQTCTYSEDIHVTSGFDIQYQNFTFSCS